MEIIKTRATFCFVMLSFLLSLRKAEAMLESTARVSVSSLLPNPRVGDTCVLLLWSSWAARELEEACGG